MASTRDTERALWNTTARQFDTDLQKILDTKPSPAVLRQKVSALLTALVKKNPTLKITGLSGAVDHILQLLKSLDTHYEGSSWSDLSDDFWLSCNRWINASPKTAAMTNLRSKLVRLAQQNPELRSVLLPLLRTGAATPEWAEGQTYKNPDTGNKVQFTSLPDKEQKKLRDQHKEEGKKDDESKEKGSGKPDEAKGKPAEPKVDPAKKIPLPDPKDLNNKEPASREDIERYFDPENPDSLKGFKLSVLVGEQNEDGTKFLQFSDEEAAKKITVGDLARANYVRQRMKQISEFIAREKKDPDFCKDISPHICAGNMGIPRGDMPQIPPRTIKQYDTYINSEDVKKARQELATKKSADGSDLNSDQLQTAKSVVSLADDWIVERKLALDAGVDPKDSKSLLTHLIDRMKDKGVSVTEKPISVRKLHATQSEIGAKATFGIATSFMSGGKHAFDPLNDFIPVSRDGYILDGHHRWSAMLTTNPDIKLRCLVIDADMADILDESHQIKGVYRQRMDKSIVDSDAPLDLEKGKDRKKGGTWKQNNGNWYGKNQEGDAGGPYDSQDSAKKFAKGESNKGRWKKNERGHWTKDEGAKDEDKKSEKKGSLKRAHQTRIAALLRSDDTDFDIQF